jgi:ABC-type cobalamin/Fe3+-siderophores transport system ATPase subunit
MKRGNDMSDIIAKLRYFPLGPVAGPAMPITTHDLDTIATSHGVSISLENVRGKTARGSGDSLHEQTMNTSFEEITQDVITVASAQEAPFRKAVGELVRMYRAPRTVFGTMGSNERGKQIVAEVCDEYDGWA